MTAAPPQSPVIEGLHSLEVRWILPGQLNAAIAGWFVRFPAETAARVELGLSDCQSYAQWLGRHPEPRVTEAPKR